MTGIIIYGYGKDESEEIRKFIEATLDKSISMQSAGGLEDIVLEEIIERGLKGNFDTQQETFMILIGMDTQDIRKILKIFPSNIRRPIFCGLTEHNVKWQFSYLMKHLLEEEEQYQKMRKEVKRKNAGVEVRSEEAVNGGE